MSDEVPPVSLQNASVAPQANDADRFAPKSFYESAGEAYKRVGTEFDFWSGKLTDSSLQMCYAVIGANWVVFGSVGTIVGNWWAKLSLLAVMLNLATHLIDSWMTSRDHQAILRRADRAPDAWQKEFEKAAKDKNPNWPFTQKMIWIGTLTRNLKFGLPLLGAGLWLIGAIIARPGSVQKPGPHLFRLDSGTRDSSRNAALPRPVGVVSLLLAPVGVEAGS